MLGLDAAWAGTAILLALVFDAVTDPLLGSLSDSLESRWGRRHPFLYAAAIPMAFTFYFVFNPPPDLEGISLFAWLLTWTVLTRASMTLYHVPHLSLGAELSEDYGERTVVVAYRVFFGFAGAALFFLLSGELFFQPSPEFPENGQLDPHAYPPMALFFGIAMMVLIFLSAIGTHSRIPHLSSAGAPAAAFSVRRLLGEMSEALSNASFRVFFVAILAFLIARGLADGVSFYMGTYFWRLETGDIFRLTAVALSGILVGTPIWAALGRRLDKRTIFLAGCTIYATITVATPVLKIAGWWPAFESPAYLALLYGMSFLAAIGAGGAVVAPGAMLADIADEHELSSGRRQEGIFFGALSFSGKAASGVGGWLAGVLLATIAFPRQAAPDAVAGDTVLLLGLIAGPGVFLLTLVGLWIASRYTLDRLRHAEIRLALDARRG